MCTHGGITTCRTSATLPPNFVHFFFANLHAIFSLQIANKYPQKGAIQDLGRERGGGLHMSDCSRSPASCMESQVRHWSDQ